MSSYKLVTAFRTPPLSFNQLRRAHHFTEAKAKKEVDEAVYELAVAQGIKDLGPSVLTIIWYPGTKRARDNDALAVFKKAAKDALVRAGVWPDDNSAFVVLDQEYIGELDRANPRIEVHIHEIEAVNSVETSSD